MTEGGSTTPPSFPTSVSVGTIAARNYLASVTLLGESLQRVMPTWRLSVLLIDAIQEELEEYRSRWPFMEFLDPSSLPIEAETATRMQLYYDLTEYATAVKPSLLQLLLERSEVAVYLDPDIEVFDDLSEVAAAALRHGIALTPHVLQPSPRDFKDTSEEAFLTTGQFNLGFIAVSRSATAFLDYWAERLERHARIDFAKGYFTDQKWVDAVPSLFDHEVLKDPGLNVAYWNLHQRSLTDGGDGVLVNGTPLRFFHYSGHNAADPTQLSKYAPNPRIAVSKDPVLKRLLIERAERMNAVSVANPPYRWNFFADGRAIPSELRTGYWYAVDEAVRNNAPLPPIPSIGSESPEFEQWLASPTRAGIPRQALLFWRGSGEAQTLFPDPERVRQQAFCRWVAAQPLFEASATASVVEDLRNDGTNETFRPHGVNVLGYLAGEFGMGEHSRTIVRSLRAAGLPVAGVSLVADGHTHGAQDEGLSDDPRYAANVVVVNADVLGDKLVKSEQWAALQPRPTAGIWAWELPEMPSAMAASARALDEIWCGSQFIADALTRSGVETPIYVHPWYVEAPNPTHLRRSDLGLPEEGFLVGFAFDVRSVPARKNPEGLLDAYLDAFGADDGAVLVLKVLNDYEGSVVARLRERAGGRTDVLFIDRRWDGIEMQAFYQLIDVYCSLHRSEGTGLTMLHAMAAGTPVIATAYSGNLDYMNDQVARLIPWTLVEVGETAAPYPADAHWAEPDRTAAAAAMRALYEDKVSAQALGARAAAHVTDLYSRIRVANWFGNRFHKLVGE